MTEESDLNNINLIEYEEFIQTETTNQNIEVDQLGLEDERQGIQEVSNILKAKDNDQDSNNESYVNCEISNQEKENNRILLTSDDQIEYDVNNSQMSNKRDISPNCDKKRQYKSNRSSLVKQQENTNKQPTLDNLAYITNSPQSSKKGSREIIFEEKIIHMQNIINAQKEQINQKDDKIAFLLNQIQEMNQQMQKKNAEISQTREDLNKAQQEIDLLKQQQMIKDEIQNGKSQILDIQIQKEEQIIQNLDNKLVASRNNSPIITSDMKIKDKGANQILSENETNITEIKQTNSKNNKKQMEKLLNSAATTSYYNNSQIGNSLSATTQKNTQKTREMGIKNPWNNQSQIASNQQLSAENNAGADTTTSQNIIHQSPMTNYNSTEVRANLNSNNKDNIANSNIPNLAQLLNEQPKQNNFCHKKNTMSTDFVYKREPLAQAQIQNIQSTFNINNIQDNHEILPNKINNNFSKYISNTNINGGLHNFQNINQNLYRSCSNHTSNILTNNTSGNKLYQPNENRVKEFYEKSNSQPPTQCSTAKGGSSLINQENNKKSESYREQYIKNIEELQKRLDFLKQKRNEYEVRPDYLNASQSTRFTSNVQNNYKDRNFNSSISSPIKQVPNLNSKLQQSQSILLNPNNNSLISSTVNQKLNENMLVHFAQIKKLENMVPSKDSYFNKQVFSVQNSQPQPLAFTSNIQKQEENVAQKYAQSPQPISSKLNKYINGNANSALNYYSSVPLIPQNDEYKSINVLNNVQNQNHQAATPNLDLGLLSAKQTINKQYFPVSSKQKFKNNEYSLQNNAYIIQDKVDSVSPTKVYSTRNSQNNYQSLLDNLALSASLKKEINNHKMSWDSLNLKDTGTPSNFISSGGISSSHIKHSSVTAFNKFAPISVKNSYQAYESEKNQNYFSKVSSSNNNHNNNTNNINTNSNKCYFNMQDQLNQVIIDNKEYCKQQ
ncbi:hypothetical protein TTHERM_00237530 (macronuclear) [Tetrahymena thermophila SB210]|uniref:Uncharacterized protein n=1 Tax=Tetrahymena thermophila (strain SB210) TaxID=312017 RepID=I7MAG3_TETTS|nr:hypothetical protein TTHERM_00237530 [Tetrahymena thermophila SB210]EAS04538.3 hypothetical protein TTHERM_00237530 [Tetrahymena thermophila SB210]|eukprot:XP_001024783.3 hypothetical protein TTHERM_00237530 [Tetrahymena thermophila SB210]